MELFLSPTQHIFFVTLPKKLCTESFQRKDIERPLKY